MDVVVHEKVFKALGDGSRRHLLDALFEKDGLRLVELEAGLEMSRVGVMKHLRILEEAGLVITEKRGRERFHYLNAVPIREITARWVGKYAGEWSARLTALRRTAEEKTMKETTDFAMRKMDIRQEITIGASRSAVFEALTRDVAAWWGVPYLIGGEDIEKRDIVFEPRVGGLLYESWGDGGGAIWGRVSYLKENEAVEIDGSIGMSDAVRGLCLFELEEDGNATRLKLSHTAYGAIEEDTEKGYDAGWTDLTGRLKRFVEEGIVSGVREG